MDPVRGCIPPKEIDIDGDANVAATAEEVTITVDVESPLVGQLEMPGAQLITVLMLVMEAVEMTGCEVKTSELVKRPPTTLLGCCSGVARTCPVGPYINSAASATLPS